MSKNIMKSKTIDIDAMRAQIDKQKQDSIKRVYESGFVVEVCIDNKIDNKKHNKIARWLNKNIGYYGEGWDFINISSSTKYFYFKNEEDAMAFKLKFI